MEWIAKQMLQDVRKRGWVVFQDGWRARDWSMEHQGTARVTGLLERAIQSVPDMIRTHKLALKEDIGEVLKVDTAAMAWLIGRALRRHTQ